MTSELCCLAIMHCCEELNRRLEPYRSAGLSWTSAARAAAYDKVNLIASCTSDQSCSTPYSQYHVWGVAVSEVELDGLTGQFELKRTDIVYDCGISLNPPLDVGQIEGGFMTGLGWFAMEEVRYNATTGAPIDATTWEYKPPTGFDVPEIFNITLLPNSPNPSGVLSSKLTGEPPVALAFSVIQALQHAVNAVREDVGLPLVPIDHVPLLVDEAASMCNVSVQSYTLS